MPKKVSSRNRGQSMTQVKSNSRIQADSDLITELVTLKDQVEDLIDIFSDTSKKSDVPRRQSSTATVVEPRLAIVVGHSAKSVGASGLSPVNPSEYPWNSHLAELIKEAGAKKGLTVGIFKRDNIGISGAYKRVRNWAATAVIELHYNWGGGKARGTETLWGPACPASEKWAMAVQAAMVKLYRRKGKQDRGLLKAPPYKRGRESVNALSTTPSCLIEPFFGDNQDDANLGGSLKRDLAQTLVETFLTHFPGTSSNSPKKAPKAILAAAAYSAPVGASKFISKIDLSTKTPFNPGEQLKGLTEIRVLKNGIVFMDTDLSTDADGSPRAKQIDPYGQLETAFNFPNQTGQKRYVNAEKIPYIVMPGSNSPDKRSKDNYLYNRLGLKLGDLAVVIWKDRIEFAMFADAGPNDHIGEGSIALVESLGWNPWNPGKKKIISGIPGPGVLTFIFPNSKITGLTPENAASKIRQTAETLFKSIGGTVS